MFLNRLMAGAYRPKTRKLSFITTMVCLEHDCGHIYESSCMSRPCPSCASNAVIPASKWRPEGAVMQIPARRKLA
jgi:hypothetical protein